LTTTSPDLGHEKSSTPSAIPPFRLIPLQKAPPFRKFHFATLKTLRHSAFLRSAFLKNHSARICLPQLGEFLNFDPAQGIRFMKRLIWFCALLSYLDMLGAAAENATVFNPNLPAEVKTHSIQQLFQNYRAGQEISSRSAAIYSAEIISRTNALEFLCAKIRHDPKLPNTHERIEDRDKAGHLLGKMGERARPAVPLLVAAMEDEDDNHRSVSQALVTLGPVAAEAKDALLEELHYKNPMAARALFRIDPNSEAILSAVIDSLKDASTFQMFANSTMNAFYECKVKSERLEKFLKSVADDSTNPLSSEAKEQLQMKTWTARRYVPPDMASYDTNNPAKLLERLRSNPNDHQLAEALSKCGPEARGEAVTILMQAIKDKRVQFVGNAISAMALFGPEAKPALPMLLDFARSDNPGSANNALFAIGNIGPAAIEAKPIAIAALNDGTPIMRWRAAYTLCQIDPERINDYLPKVMEPLLSAEDISDFGIRSLGTFGPRAALVAPELEKLLENEKKRLTAAEALAKIRPESGAKLAQAVTEFLKSENVYERDRAARLLGEIGPAAAATLPALREAARSDDTEFAKIVQESIHKIEGKGAI
jgi:HEAT repeat protein